MMIKNIKLSVKLNFNANLTELIM